MRVSLTAFVLLLLASFPAPAQFSAVEVVSGDVAGLRQAILDINAAGNGRIQIIADSNGEFPAFEFTDDYQDSGNALPVVTGNVITFSANKDVQFIGNGSFRFLEVAGMGGIAINRGTYRDFASDGDGGVVLVRDEGRVTTFAAKFIDNRAAGNGGVVATTDNARYVGDLCRYERNTAQLGGAISLESTPPRAFDYHDVERSTFVRNRATVFGCDLNVQTPANATVRISNNTFDGDCGNVLVENPSGNMSFFGNTFAGSGVSIDSTATAQLFGNIFGAVDGSQKHFQTQATCRDFGSGAFESLGNNISLDDTCFLDQATDLPDTDPMLGNKTSAGNYALMAGSPAIEGGGSELVDVGGELRLPCGYADAEGLGRPQDSDGDGIFACEIGSVEVQGGEDIGPTQSGAYYDLGRDGEGVFLEMLGDGRALLAKFTYTPEADGAAWMLGVGNVVGNSVVMDTMTQPVGGVFGAGFDADQIDRQPVGAMSMVFSNCLSGVEPGVQSFQASPGSPFEDRLVDATRLTLLLPCGGSTPSPILGRSGSFFDVNRSGEGIVVQWLAPDRVLVVWYTYTPSGEQMWLISQNSQVEGNTVTATMVYPTGFTAFGQDFDSEQIELSPWGSITLDYQPGCNSIDFSYQATAMGYGSGSYDYTRLTTLDGVECDL